MKLWPSIIPPTLGPVISHFQDVSTCCWFWFFPTARSAWNATRPALTWPSPSTRTPADVNWHLGIRQARIILNNKQIRGLSESVSILVSLPYKHGHRPLGHSPCPKQYGLFHTDKKKKKLWTDLPSTSSLSLCSSLHLRRLSGSAWSRSALEIAA